MVLQAAPTRQTPSSRQDAWSATFETNTAANHAPSPGRNNNNDLLELHQVFSAPKVRHTVFATGLSEEHLCLDQGEKENQP